MTNTPRSERLHIGIFGRRNAGKSSLLNAIAGQNVAIVSPTKGTTTDPVYKTMELLPLGPVVLVDTAGLDDDGELGPQRIKKTRNILRKTDLAILVVGVDAALSQEDNMLIDLFEATGVKHMVVYNNSTAPTENTRKTWVNACTSENILALKEKIAQACQADKPPQKLVSDLLSPGDMVVLVVHVDESAPKNRLILPQQQTIRDILDAQAVPVITQATGLADTLGKLSQPPKLVITDSQIFAAVAQKTPQSVGLTSFSILMARYKGLLAGAVEGAAILDTIQDSDHILIAEGCTHHRQCDDIGTVKIPRWIEAHTGAKPVYTFTAGEDFPESLEKFKLIIHCGGCMQNVREMQHRQNAAQKHNVPMTNYGIAISHMQGILQRCIKPFET